MKGLKRTDLCPGNLSNQKYEAKMNMINYFHFIRNAKAHKETVAWKAKKYIESNDNSHDQGNDPLRNSSPKAIKHDIIKLPTKTTHRQTYRQKLLDESNELLAERLIRIKSAKRHRKKYDFGRHTIDSFDKNAGNAFSGPKTVGLTHDNGRTVIDCYQAVHNSNDIYKEIHGAANDYIRVQKKINEENNLLYNNIVNIRSAYPKSSHDKFYEYHHRIRGLLSKQPEQLVHLNITTLPKIKQEINSPISMKKNSPTSRPTSAINKPSYGLNNPSSPAKKGEINNLIPLVQDSTKDKIVRPISAPERILKQMLEKIVNE